MTEDLLIKEKGFRQLNKELERKAHDLVNKINIVINTHGNECSASNASKVRKDEANVTKEGVDYPRNVKRLNEDDIQPSFHRNSSLPHIFGQFSALRSKVELQKDEQNDGIRRKSLANDTVINLFKAKIDVLLDELQTIRVEYKKKCDVCKSLVSENRKYKIKLQTETESLKETIAKLESDIKDLQCRSQTLNSENFILKKDLDKIQRQMKIMNQESSNQILRLNRSLENNDKLKGVLKNFQVEEKELKAQIKQLQESRRSTVHSLGKQLSEVIQILKRQTTIVDNLKRQNACLAAFGQLKLIKEDFSRLLDEKLETVR